MLMNDNEYFQVLEDIKTRIRVAQYQAIIGANREMIMLYWNTGNYINTHKSWGNKFIENLSRDIRTEFPGITGFSVRNMKYMAKFASTYGDTDFVQRALHRLPWRHNILIMDKVKDAGQREWYIARTVENGWTSDVLALQIESGLYNRQVAVNKTSNFDKLLPAPQSELVSQTVKDPYIFDFITAREKYVEDEIRRELVRNISKLLLELGKGFAYVGEEYNLEVEGEDFYIEYSDSRFIPIQ